MYPLSIAFKMIVVIHFSSIDVSEREPVQDKYMSRELKTPQLTAMQPAVQTI